MSRSHRPTWIALFLGGFVGCAAYVALLYSQPVQRGQTKITLSTQQMVQIVHKDRMRAEKTLAQWLITLEARVFQVIPAHGMAEVLLDPVVGGWVAVYLSKARATGLKRGDTVRVECSVLEIQDHPTLPHTVKIWLHRCA